MKRIKNAIRYMIFIALNVMMILSFHSYINFIFLVGMLLMLLYSVYGTWLLSGRLEVSVQMPGEALTRGEDFYIYFRLKNPLWIALVNADINIRISNPFYGDESVQTINMPVRARQTTELVLPVNMSYCGRVVVKAETIALTDLFGIYQKKTAIDVDSESILMPDGRTMDSEAGRIYMLGVTEAMESKEKGYDFSDISGIREYIPGDKLQNIHWKLSVKKDSLMVKERVSVSAMQLSVFVDLRNDADMRLEEILKLADGMTRSFVVQNLPFTVYYYSNNMGELKNCYIGNEADRKEWLMMLLYDRCNVDTESAEPLFRKQQVSHSTYLYIGLDDGTSKEGAVYGAKNTVAVLRHS